MSRHLTTALIAAIALGAAALAVEPAAAMPVAGAAISDTAAPAVGGVEQVRLFHRGFRHRGFGYRRPFGYRRGYGYRRGIPGHPIRRILRAL